MDFNRFSFGVNIYGYMQSEKGLGTAVRSDIYSLKSVKIPFALNNSGDSGSANVNAEFNSFSSENPYLFNLIHINPNTTIRLENDSNIYFHEYIAKYTNYLNGHYNIGYWVWELDNIPEYWVTLSKYVDEIWAPSYFSMQAISKSLNIPVVRIPHSIAITENSFNKVIKKIDLKISDDIFLFLFIFDAGSFIERKNPFALIEAFKKAFKPDEKVMLFIKSSRSNFNRAKFYEMLNAIKGYNITVSDSVLTRDEIYSLIYACDCYVSLHRSEGFGLTMAEAMALGKPVIATGYSGNMDFMNMENSYPVDYRLVELERDYGPYQKGNYWAEPYINHAAELMREVFEKREESASVGAKGEYCIKKYFSPEAVGKIYKARLNNIMNDYENKICM